MKTKISLFLRSVRENGFNMTLGKVFVKKIGYIFLDAQRKNRFLEQKNLISAIDLTPENFRENFELLKKASEIPERIQSINWFLPNFEHALYGGIYTILRFSAFFQENGIKNRIIIYDNPFADIDKIRKVSVEAFPILSNSEFSAYDGKIDSLPECDATISTFWTSCYLSIKFNKTKKKFYFIQDYEPLFYSANSYYALAEATYRFGFKGIINTPGLSEFVHSQHGMECQSFYPCVDEKIYHITELQIQEKLRKKVLDIFIYGRPNHDRNAFELAIIALIKLKKKYGSKINIISAGDVWEEDDYGVKGIIKNVGRLGSLKEVADLYRKCDIGLVFMFTKHPSYQPFEYMSCGCVVVTNYNNANIWFLKDGVNCILAEPTPSCIVERVSEVIDDHVLRSSLIQNGLTEIEKHSWTGECEKIHKYINA